jgi:hypothetical protein
LYIWTQIETNGASFGVSKIEHAKEDEEAEVSSVDNSKRVQKGNKPLLKYAKTQEEKDAIREANETERAVKSASQCSLSPPGGKRLET